MGEHSDRRRGSRSGGDRERRGDYDRDRDDRYYKKKRESWRRNDASRADSDDEDNHRASKLVRLVENKMRFMWLVCGNRLFHNVCVG